MSQVHETTPLVAVVVKDPPLISPRDDDDTAAAALTRTMSSFECGGDEMSNYSSYRLYQASQNTRNLIFVVIGFAILYLILGFGKRSIMSYTSFGTTHTTFA